MNSTQATVSRIPVPLDPEPETIPNLRAAAEAGAALEAADTAGIKAIFDGVASRQRLLHRELLLKAPTENASEYAALVGQLKGLSEVEGIAEQVVARGKEAARKLRAAEQKEHS